MSGLQPRPPARAPHLDVQEHGNSLRVATSSPHLVSLGCGRLSTAVTIHPIKQGGVTIVGSHSGQHIMLQGAGVEGEHCRIENSHGVVTLYPVNGVTTVDGQVTQHPTRLQQGCMVGIGRSNFLRFNHPEEAHMMKAVLPEHAAAPHQQMYSSNNLQRELDLTYKRNKPPVAPRKVFKEVDSEEDLPSQHTIKDKVNKFEYYLRNSQKNADSWSPKVFSSNSLTVNTPAKDVIGKDAPYNYNVNRVMLNESKGVDVRSCSYSNVAVRKEVYREDAGGGYGRVQQNGGGEMKRQGQKVLVKAPSPSFNRNPVFNNTQQHNVQHNMQDNNKAATYAQSSGGSDESQKFLEEQRLQEILSMCAEYERQISSGTPTTPTERKPHKQIITNGSLPRSPHSMQPSNIIQASDGSYRFDTARHRAENSPMRSQSSPPANKQANKLSSYENVTIQTNEHHSSYENFSLERKTGRQFPITELSSPVMIRKMKSAQNYATSPSEESNHRSPNNHLTPYENLMVTRGNVSPYMNVNPHSPNSHSPRTRIKTTYAHKNTTPQRFVFPSPPPLENDYDIYNTNTTNNHISNGDTNGRPKGQGIEKQLSLTEEIPMIDDTEFANELEMRIAKLKPENRKNDEEVVDDLKYLKTLSDEQRSRNFEEIRRDLMADIPELDEIHRDIDRNLSRSYTNNRDSEDLHKITEELKHVRLEDEVFETSKKDEQSPVRSKFEKTDSEIFGSEADILDTPSEQAVSAEEESKPQANDYISVPTNVLNEFVAPADYPIVQEVSEVAVSRLELLRCRRKKVLSDIHQVKSSMADIRCQEDDILRELEMEKALLQGEYDSEMAILGLEQRKLGSLLQQARDSEQDMSKLKQQQQQQQNISTHNLQQARDTVSRLEKEFSSHTATLEELRNAQEALDTERKAFEDLEFHHLEEEADWLAQREELQNEISSLSQKIETQKSRILNLRFETSNNLNSAVEETKSLQTEYANLLNRIETLTADLQTIEKDIKEAVRDIGVEYRNTEQASLEDKRYRIKSGDFSPPSSDNEELNDKECFENRKKSVSEKLNSMDQMSRSMIVDLGEKRSISDLVDEDKDRSLPSAEASPHKIVQEEVKEVTEVQGDTSPETKEKKPGFWERNFDSLSRLKNKDKKAKNQIKNDIMSQSLNENMFFNNENIESEYGSFEKCNSLKSSKKNKEMTKVKSGEVPTSPKASDKSRIPTLAVLGKIMRKDSFGKKPKEDKSKPSEETANNNKENIDLNVKKDEVVIQNEGFRMEDETEQEQKNSKHRYVKNSKSGITDNKYLNKCTKTVHPAITIIPDQEDVRHSFHEDSRASYADSLEGDVSQQLPVRMTADDSISARVPSQEDMDRISKVHLDAPLIHTEQDMHSLGRRTIDSLREIEKNRVAMLEQQGCQVMEDEREKISELKRRVQTETTLQWQLKREQDNNNSTLDSSGTAADSTLDSTSLEKEQFRHSGAESFTSTGVVEDVSSCCDSPQELANDVQLTSTNNTGFSYDTPRRNRNSSNQPSWRQDLQRPLTRYLPIDTEDLNLREHIQTAGHQVELCPHVTIDATSCRGYLHKLGAKFHGWSKRWFVFDRTSKTFIYYSDKNEKKPRGGAYFQVISEVYLDHLNVSKSPTPLTTFVLKTRQRRYYLTAPSGQAARIWIDVLFTGAQGYTHYLH